MNREELPRNEAVAVVAASATRLFPTVSQQQARELAALLLRDLEARGITLVRNGKAAQPGADGF